MNDISVLKITFGEEIYNVILVSRPNTLYTVYVCDYYYFTVYASCGHQNSLSLILIKKKSSCLDSFDTASEKK